MFGRMAGFVSVLVCAAAAGCSDGSAGEPEQAVESSQSALRTRDSGAVFTSSNEAQGNRVLAFARDEHGRLGDPVAYPTGGLGSGNSLGSQGALVLTEDRRFLLVVNAGSNDVSTFAVHGHHLHLRDRKPSGGGRPVSVTERRGLVFVVNATSPANVAGFRLQRDGQLEPIEGSVAALSTEAPAPAQVQLARHGRTLVVTERASHAIDVFRVDGRGVLGPRATTPSAGRTPFGFDLAGDDTLVVSEAASGSMSTYSLSPHGGASLITGPVPNGQAAPCWVVATRDGRLAFTANAGSASISSYGVARRGELTLHDARAGVLPQTSNPLDMALDRQEEHLFVLDRGTGISTFTLHGTSLDFAGSTTGTTPFASGIAAY